MLLSKRWKVTYYDDSTHPNPLLETVMNDLQKSGWTIFQVIPGWAKPDGAIYFTKIICWRFQE
jgi:hypothetical protein